VPTRKAIRAISMGMREISIGSEMYRRAYAAELGLAPVEVVVMGHLYTAAGPLTPRAIANLIGFTTGSTTAVLNRVERAGYLARKANPADGRSFLIALTPGGRHAMDWVYEQLDKHVSEALAHFPPEELLYLAPLMTALGTYMRNATPLDDDIAGEDEGDIRLSR